MDDIVENNCVDVDTAPPEEIEKLFTRKYNLVTNHRVAETKPCINTIAGNKSLRIAVGLSDKTIQVYDFNDRLSLVHSYVAHDDAVREVVFCPEDEFLLYSCADDGFVKLWDTRIGGECVRAFRDGQNDLISSFACMDVSCNGKIICAGSPLMGQDVFMVFWDPRRPLPLGGYWNSHYDDLMQLRFHKERPEIIASGAQDGLANVFNIAEAAEHVALAHTFNATNAVERLAWLPADRLACVTQAADLQVWDTLTGGLFCEYQKEYIARCIKRSRLDDCYLVDVFQPAAGDPVLLAGSYGGDGSVLRSLLVNDRRLLPCTNFAENTEIVRCCHYNKEHDILVTGSENGLICVWRRDSSAGGSSGQPAAAAGAQTEGLAPRA